MKIITWNCNMAFRKKAKYILEYKPDIIIVPECEHPDKLKFDVGTPIPTDIFWYGTNRNKGIGIFSYSSYRFKLMDEHNPDIKIILPIAVTGGDIDFTLFAVWAYNPDDYYYKYIGQVWKAIIQYEDIMKNPRVIIGGDFNSNVLWDKLERRISHTMMVDKLASLNILSTYHQYFNIKQGEEIHPTLFMYRHQNKPYHIDYCFASANMIEKLESVEVGSYEVWTRHSDHKPLIVTFSN